MISKKEFLKKYRITEDTFKASGLDYAELQNIYRDYEAKANDFRVAGNAVVECLRHVPQVHSLKFRTKDPEHLIEKIIRKKAENPDRVITLETYQTEITDIIGVRALHLFKDDWSAIHTAILSTWELHETPKAYLREGDPVEQFKAAGCETRPHSAGYRSVHYLVESRPTKSLFIAEVQVRTIFEEGWSEIDHKLRYPYDLNNAILAEYLALFNRFAGAADEMGTYIQKLMAALKEQERQYQESLELHKKEKAKILADLEAIKKELKSETESKKKLQEVIDSVSSYPSKPSLPIGLSAQAHPLPIWGNTSWGEDGVVARLLSSDALSTSAIIHAGMLSSLCSKCGKTYQPLSVSPLNQCTECLSGVGRITINSPNNPKKDGPS